jgi:CBS domain-containing protein
MDKDRMRTAEELLEEKGSQLYFVSPGTKIIDALRLMVEKKIGAILIKDGDEIVGIWTERDHIEDSILPDFNVNSSRIDDYMTKKLITVKHDEKIYNIADKILGLRIRHLLVEREGKYIGLLSAGDIIRAELHIRTEEWKELDRIVHLEYYDKWSEKKGK